jgi:hypothetical protein
MKAVLSAEHLAKYRKDLGQGYVIDTSKPLHQPCLVECSHLIWENQTITILEANLNPIPR